MEIIPTILTDQVTEVQQKLRLLQGKVPWVHLDVIDGVFAERKTVEPAILLEYEEQFNFEVHLMVDVPEEWIQQCQLAKADRVIGQIERMEDQMSFVDGVLAADMEVGLAIDLDTTVGMIAEDAWMWLDVILLMGVKAGASGQEFQSSILEKVKMIDQRRKRHGLTLKIEVDGGVNLNTIRLIQETGVDVVAAHTAVYEGGDIERNLKELNLIL